MRLVIATKNQGKAKEFKEMLGDRAAVYSLLDFEEIPEVEETGTSFAENAIIKAEAICKAFEIPVLADDSGLEVDALDGAPGIYSARYAGKEKDDQKNNQKLLEQLGGLALEKRSARFVCALAVALPQEETKVVHGYCEGTIAKEQQGNNGFGYDPLFLLPELNRTMAELEAEEKNKLSHRRKALEKLIQRWDEWF
ncbi:XTP/dITP diphosphatase [Salsuginibacillus kocurii]|uniref:XTP/dITP diphosphatase n=1 Tax=Salsuginibacillus kocurii TaxID=427078 RepID=UPI00037967D0|nr:XTP/dITP diphosphatase [Salsuginibacillus kocurii]